MRICLYCSSLLKMKGTWSQWLSTYSPVCEKCREKFQVITGPICNRCGRLYTRSDFTVCQETCDECLIRWQQMPKFLGNTSLFLYDEVGKEWMNRFKFRGDSILIQMFQKEISCFWRTKRRTIDKIIPIPLSKERALERRFNQAEEIAKMMNVDKIALLLGSQSQEKQSKRSKYERLHQDNPFYVLSDEYHKHTKKNMGSILLVDDIYTTGATIWHAVNAIYTCFVCEIYCFTLFRASSVKILSGFDDNINEPKLNNNVGDNMSGLSNCPECGKIFVKTSTKMVCETCYREDLKRLDTVLNYLKKRSNRQATLQEVEEATKVPVEIIERFIKTGKIRITSLPNFSYPCKQCGARIREGNLCATCLDNLSGKVRRSEEIKQAEEEVKQRIIKNETVTYLSKEE